MAQAKIVGVIPSPVKIDAVFWIEEMETGEWSLSRDPIIAFVVWERIDEFANKEDDETKSIYSYLEPIMFDSDGCFDDPSDNLNFLGFALEGQRPNLWDWKEEIKSFKERMQRREKEGHE